MHIYVLFRTHSITLSSLLVLDDLNRLNEIVLSSEDRATCFTLSTKLLVFFELPKLRLQLLILPPKLLHALLVCFTDIASLRCGGWHAAISGGCFDGHAGIALTI